MADNVVNNLDQMRSMREFRSSMQDFLGVVREAEQTFAAQGDTSLKESTERLAETVSTIEETEEMLRKFNLGEITLEQLEAFRDEVAARRP